MSFFQNTGPCGQIDANDHVNTDSYTYYAFQGDYEGGMNLIYKGLARPGSNTAEPVWQIALLTYDSNNNITMIQWPLRKEDNTNASSPNTAAASNFYEFVWTLRTDYTYV